MQPRLAQFWHYQPAHALNEGQVSMWFVIGGLTFVVSAVSALMFGRLLAKASSGQALNPHVVRGPSRGADIQARRLMIAEHAARHRSLEVHVN